MQDRECLSEFHHVFPIVVVLEFWLHVSLDVNHVGVG
jgi:hypothetical protein